jgi:hypothetical protein
MNRLCFNQIALSSFAALAVLSSAGTKANADLVLTFTGSNSSTIIDFEYSGSATVTSTSAGTTGNLSFLGATLDAGQTPFNGGGFLEFTPITGGATGLNVTTGDTTFANTVFVGTLSSGIRYGMSSSGIDNIVFGAGDTLEWSGAGTIDLADAGLDWGYFNTGTYTSSGLPLSGGFGNPDTLWGFESQLVITEIPAPGSLAMFGVIAASATRRRR